MKRILTLLLLAFLWGLWLYLFVGAARFAYAFTHNIPEAVLPGSPAGLDLSDSIEWTKAVALLWGTPILLGILTWRSLRRGHSSSRTDKYASN
jgi:hypothetical protein